MQILISGSTGFIGEALVSFLKNQGHRVLRLRHAQSLAAKNSEDFFWDEKHGIHNIKALPPIEAVIHLAGENLTASRWTQDFKQRLWQSRVEGSSAIVRSILSLHTAPKLFISASAIGYYGNRGNEALSEESNQGTGFLADLCAAWEETSAPLAQAKIRSVKTRFGLVLHPSGGVLKKLLLPFRLGLGGSLGDGKHFQSFIHLHDVLRAINFLFENPTLEGPVNLVCPNPLSQKDFSKTLGAALRRPVFLKTPAFFLRLLFGEMAEEALLASARVFPEKLLKAGFSFRWPNLKTIFEDFFGSF